MTSHNSARGFSLLELLTVVAIVGIMAALAVPSMTGWLGKSSFSDQKAVLYDTLTRARNMANSRDECVKVTIDGSTMHITPYAQGAQPNCADPLGAATIAIPDVTLPTGYTIENFSTGSASIVFNTTGGLREATTISIYMSDTTGNRQGFTIYPALGQIRNAN
jgi:prepilin-type N-terminal cleavage/methylation domain-containing protein